MNSSFFTGNGKKYSSLRVQPSTTKKQTTVNKFVYKLPKCPINDTSSVSIQDANTSQKSNISSDIFNDTVNDSSKNSGHEDGWDDMDDFEEPASQRRKSLTLSAKKVNAGKSDFKLKQSNSSQPSLNNTSQTNSVQDVYIDLSSDNSSDAIQPVEITDLLRDKGSTTAKKAPTSVPGTPPRVRTPLTPSKSRDGSLSEDEQMSRDLSRQDLLILQKKKMELELLQTKKEREKRERLLEIQMRNFRSAANNAKEKEVSRDNSNSGELNLVSSPVKPNLSHLKTAGAKEKPNVHGDAIPTAQVDKRLLDEVRDEEEKTGSDSSNCGLLPSEFSPVLPTPAQVNTKDAKEKLNNSDLNSWLIEFNSNPALDPVTQKMSEHELSSLINKLKKCDENILEKVFKWFVSLPPELVENLPGCRNAKTLLTGFKITHQRIKAKIKQSEGIIKKKRSENRYCDSLLSDDENFTSAADLIRNDNENCSYFEDKSVTVNNTFNRDDSVESDTGNDSFNGVSYFMEPNKSDLNNESAPDISRLKSPDYSNSSSSNFVFKSSKNISSNFSKSEPFQVSGNDLFDNSPNNNNILSKGKVSTLCNSRDITKDSFSNRLYASKPDLTLAEPRVQSSIISINSSLESSKIESPQSVISLNSTVDDANTSKNSAFGGFVPKVKRSVMKNNETCNTLPISGSGNRSCVGMSADNLRRSSQLSSAQNQWSESPVTVSPSLNSNPFSFSTPNTNSSKAQFLPKGPFTPMSSLPRGGESFHESKSKYEAQTPSTSSDWPDPEMDDFAQSIADDNDFYEASRPTGKPEKRKSLSGYNKDNDDAEHFKGRQYPHSANMFKVFRETFGLHSFRPNQMEAVNAAMLGHDCFILMPTGGGKSVCYQLPAVLTPGVTIIISPLISLIHDQVQKLKSLDIPAQFLSGGMKLDEMDRVFNDLSRREPELKILFVTPERVMGSGKLQDAFGSLHKRRLLARFIIDEAHCVSQWGHDFRPDYKQLNCLREKYSGVPIMALTATATVRVRHDILLQLKMKDPKWFISGFDRPNLRYQILPKSGNVVTLRNIAELINTKFPKKSGIVYCFSRHETSTVAEALKQSGIKAACYHAGLTDLQRTKAQTDWITDRIKVVCATIAFGMGIDKPDVRFVIHFTIPKSLEGYYQEAGRAGRDGEPSSCILYYSFKDMYRIRGIIEGEQGNKDSKEIHLQNLWTMVRFCEDMKHCRRFLQLKYFDESYDRNKCIANAATTCDNCMGKDNYRMVDVTADCRKLFKGLKEIGMRQRANITINLLVDIVKGSKIKKILDCGFDKSSIHNSMASWNKTELNHLFHKLLLEGYLQDYLIPSKEGIVNSYIKIGPKADSVFNNASTKIEIAVTIREGQKSSADGEDGAGESSSSVNAALRELQERCYTALLDAVSKIADALNMKTASIFPAQAVRSMSKELPISEDEFLKIVGVTRANLEKYGKPLLEITQMYAAEKLVTCKELAEEEENNVMSGGAEWAAADAAQKSFYFAKEGGKGDGGGKQKFKKRGFKRKRANSGKRATKKSKSNWNSNSGGTSWGEGSSRGGGSSSRGRGSSSRGGGSSSRGGGSSSRGGGGGDKSYLKSNAKMPPSNRPGFMPPPRVYHAN